MAAKQYMELAATCLETIDKIEATTTLEEVLDVYTAFVEQYGFNSVAMCQLANPHLLENPTSQIFISNWNDEWAEHWWKSGYMEHDPIIQFMLKTRKPFSWDTAYQYASKYGRKILDESTDFQFKTGIAFPVTTGTGPLGCVSLGTDEISIDPTALSIIELVSINCYMHMVKLRGLEAEYGLSALSKREIEVLHLIAAGKTNWEIGVMLGISEETVKTYVKAIMKKLNATSRAQAVSTAIRHGLIIP